MPASCVILAISNPDLSLVCRGETVYVFGCSMAPNRHCTSLSAARGRIEVCFGLGEPDIGDEIEHCDREATFGSLQRPGCSNEWNRIRVPVRASTGSAFPSCLVGLGKQLAPSSPYPS